MIHIVSRKIISNNKVISFLLILCSFFLANCAPTSILKQDNENTIEFSIIEDLTLSDTSQLTIDECSEKINEYAQSISFKEGDTIPSDVVIFIDFDDVYMSWQDFDVDVICTLANYGIYLTHESFLAPNKGMIWFINMGE
jgi:hypothetical protein